MLGSEGSLFLGIRKAIPFFYEGENTLVKRGKRLCSIRDYCKTCIFGIMGETPVGTRSFETVRLGST